MHIMYLCVGVYECKPATANIAYYIHKEYAQTALFNAFITSVVLDHEK